jgi:hypothetical protein
MLGRQEVDKTSPSRLAGPTLEVSQFDQTFVLAALARQGPDDLILVFFLAAPMLLEIECRSAVIAFMPAWYPGICGGSDSFRLIFSAVASFAPDD